jgi:hypothetical protein
VTLDPPVLVMVSDAAELPLTCTLPKLTLDWVAARVPAVTPLPESPMFKVEFDALLEIETPPVTAPLLCGANAMLKFVLCPAARVRGKLIPLRLNPEPVAVAPVMVTLDPPELVKVWLAVWFLLSWTLPKLTLEGLALSDPALTPVPESPTEREAFDALLVIERPPVTAPLVCGANPTVKLAL